MIMNRSQNSPNFSPLSPLSINVPAHQHDQTNRKEPIDLFSPKGRPMRHHSADRRYDESFSWTMRPKASCPPRNHTANSSSSSPVSIAKNQEDVKMVVRLRRMKRRLLQEHTKDQQPEMASSFSSSPTERNL